MKRNDYKRTVSKHNLSRVQRRTYGSPGHFNQMAICNVFIEQHFGFVNFISISHNHPQSCPISKSLV